MEAVLFLKFGTVGIKMGGISDNNISSFSSLVSHLESSSSQMVDKEYRDILESFLRKDVAVPSGTYFIHGLTVAGGEYSDEARVIFKYPNNNKNGVYHDLLLSRRGTDFDFLNDDDEVVESGSETDSEGTLYSSSAFDALYFNGINQNPTGNVKKIKFYKRTTVQTFTSRTEFNNSQKPELSQWDNATYVTNSQRTADPVHGSGDSKKWYDLDLNDGNEFHIELDTESSDPVNLSLKNAASFYGFTESSSNHWGFTSSSNDTLSSGPYFSHSIFLYIHKSATLSSNEIKIQRLNFDFGNNINVDLWSSTSYVSMSNPFSNTTLLRLNIVRTPAGWGFNVFDFNNRIHNKVPTRLRVQFSPSSSLNLNRVYFKSNDANVTANFGNSFDNLNSSAGNSSGGSWNYIASTANHTHFEINQELTGLSFGWDMINNREIYRPYERVVSVEIMGYHNITSLENSFYNCDDLTSFDLSMYQNRQNITNLKNAFYGCTQLETLNGISDLTRSWSSSELEGAFYNTTDTSLNLDLSNWCVSNVSSAPNNFATNTAGWYSTTSNHPNWGASCS